MIEKMVLYLVSQMESKKMIDKADRERYKYALVTMTERTITVGTVLLIGLVFNQLIPTICFLVFFLSLRKRTGGYHADKFWQCYIMTVITYILIIQVADVLSENMVAMYVMLSFTVLVIGVIGTVNHPNMDMDKDELKESKKAARLCVLMEVLVIAALIALKINDLYASYMSLAIILCASLLCVAKVVKQEVKQDEENRENQ
ncbi:MAG: accessory gene regulator B family protein [Lachnospiraceae bacterium]|nr:accessory gene regulator B family protein [Lachnospiraceae bacterium]